MVRIPGRMNFTRAALAAFVWLAGMQPALALNCQEVRHLVGQYLKMHFSHRDFDDELSRRTFDNFIKLWDPGKVYFLKSDVTELEQKYATKLDDMVMDSDCRAIEDIMKIYSKRFAERQKSITDHINAKHDFTIDEYMEIDRKKMEFATTTEEISERWRQRIKFQLLQLKGTLQDLEKAREKLHKRYALALKRHNELTSDDMYSFFLNAYSSGLDPHSEYMSAESLEDFRISTRLSLEGIGAVLRSDDGFTRIQSLVPGGAAAKTGKVKVDDKIIAVAQGNEPPVDVIDMDLREVVKLIRGTRGTEVRLTLVREESAKAVQLVVPIIREQIQLKDRAARSAIYPVNVDAAAGQPARQYKVGVLELPSFYMDFEGRQSGEKGYRSSSADMKNEITNLKKQGADAIIVDLRSNGGGSLDESIAIAGLFFDKGPVVQIKDTRGSIYVQKDEEPSTLYGGPLLVMINRQSASASEIFAGAIQDYKRGLIVGDTHTFGKGTVQNLNDIDERLGAIKVTISKFYRPSGASTQLKGVESDITLPDVMEEYEIGEKHYDYALPWERIKSSEFSAHSQVSPELVKALTEASRSRIQKDEGFTKIYDAIKEYKAGAESRTKVSLKEEKPEDKAAADKKIADGKKDKDKKKPVPAEEELDEDQPRPITEDFHLQETLRIAADYVQALNKRPLAKVSLPDLGKVTVADSKAEEKSDKVKSQP